MFKKAKNIFFISSFILFIFLISKHYFSEKNIIHTNKIRSFYLLPNSINGDDLPVLINDTENIILYKNEVEDFKKNRKKRFWEKLISD